MDAADPGQSGNGRPPVDDLFTQTAMSGDVERAGSMPVGVDGLLAGDPTYIARARFSGVGILRGANARFLRICRGTIGESSLVDLVAAGQQDEIAKLLGGGPLPSELQKVHFAAGDQAPTTLLVAWAREGEELALVGEPPLEDLEASQAMLVKLLARISDLARESTKKTAELERALADLHSAQATMVHRERVAGFGQMTAGVVRELASPLAEARLSLPLLEQSVGGILALLERFGDGLDAIESVRPELLDAIRVQAETIDAPSLGERVPALLASVSAGVERASRLVETLDTFSRLDEAAVRIVDLRAALAPAVDVASRLAAESGTRFTDDIGDLAAVACSSEELSRAVLNLLVNAVHAAGPGGSVHLATRLVDDEVHLVIADNGPGVPADVADRVFDPFYTTRAGGQGVGLGLTVARAIAEASGGRLTQDAAPGGGAIFTIHLPRDLAGAGRV